MKKTNECFKLLTKEVCNKFADFEKRNQGFHLVHHLGWTDYGKFKADLQTRTLAAKAWGVLC